MYYKTALRTILLLGISIPIHASYRRRSRHQRANFPSLARKHPHQRLLRNILPLQRSSNRLQIHSHNRTMLSRLSTIDPQRTNRFNTQRIRRRPASGHSGHRPSRLQHQHSRLRSLHLDAIDTRGAHRHTRSLRPHTPSTKLPTSSPARLGRHPTRQHHPTQSRTRSSSPASHPLFMQ